MRLASGILALVLIFGESIGASPRNWATEFPELAARMPHFNERMSSEYPDVRRITVLHLINFEYRNARLYVPFLRAVLKDEDPELAWLALENLHHYGVIVSAGELPIKILVPLNGMVTVRSQADRERLRESTRPLAISPKQRGPESPSSESVDARCAWALKALVVLGDASAPKLAESLKSSTNPFARYSVAVAIQKTDRKEALKILRQLVESKVHFYSWRAAEEIVRMGDRSALPALCDALGEVEPSQRLGLAGVIFDITGHYSLNSGECRRHLDGK